MRIVHISFRNLWTMSDKGSELTIGHRLDIGQNRNISGREQGLDVSGHEKGMETNKDTDS